MPRKWKALLTFWDILLLAAHLRFQPCFGVPRLAKTHSSCPYLYTEGLGHLLLLEDPVQNVEKTALEQSFRDFSVLNYLGIDPISEPFSFFLYLFSDICIGRNLPSLAAYTCSFLERVV